MGTIDIIRLIQLSLLDFDVEKRFRLFCNLGEEVRLHNWDPKDLPPYRTSEFMFVLETKNNIDKEKWDTLMVRIGPARDEEERRPYALEMIRFFIAGGIIDCYKRNKRINEKK